MGKKNYSTSLNQSSSRPRKKLLWVLLLIVAIGGILALLELTNTTHLFHKQKAVSGTIPTINSNTTAATPAKTDGNTPVNPPQSQDTKPGPSAGGSSSPTSDELIAPFGSFVSNHYPKLNGSKDEQAEESVCRTTAGASCFVRFTQGSVVRKLDTKTTNGNGAVIWDWNIKDSGLTLGSWKVEAVATLSNQTKVTEDKFTMEIQP